jgi:hypothetical protein
MLDISMSENELTPQKIRHYLLTGALLGSAAGFGISSSYRELRLLSHRPRAATFRKEFHANVKKLESLGLLVRIDPSRKKDPVGSPEEIIIINPKNGIQQIFKVYTDLNPKKVPKKLYDSIMKANIQFRDAQKKHKQKRAAILGPALKEGIPVGLGFGVIGGAIGAVRNRKRQGKGKK